MDRTIVTTSISPTKFASTQFWGGILLLLVALTFYYFAVLRIDYSKTMLLDLAPHPDATEYFAQAQGLRMDGWPSIQIGYEKLPSRYPFGYPALMLPWLKVLPEADAVLAPFRTSQTMGLLLLLAVFAFYAYLAMPLTAGFAVLLLATLPGFFTFCRSSLSEVSASLPIVLAFMFAYLGIKEERRWKIYLSAILLGLSLNIRIQSVLLAPLLLAMALFPVGGNRLRWFLHCTAVLVVFALVASPVLVMNTIQFHSPFNTGYDFWASYSSVNRLLFSRDYIPVNSAALWKEFTLQPFGYHPADVFGTGTSFVPAFILLVAVAVLPVTWAAKNILSGKRIVPALIVLVLFAGACLGYPSRSGYNTRDIDRSQAWDALHFVTPPSQSIEFVAQKDFARRLGRQPGIVLSDIDPVYLNALLPRSFVAAPIDGKHHYKWSYLWRYDRPQALALVERGLEQSLPVYALFVSQDQMTAQQSRLPNVPGYEWRILNDSNDKVAILKLTAIGPDQATPPPE